MGSEALNEDSHLVRDAIRELMQRGATLNEIAADSGANINSLKQFLYRSGENPRGGTTFRILRSYVSRRGFMDSRHDSASISQLRPDELEHLTQSFIAYRMSLSGNYVIRYGINTQVHESIMQFDCTITGRASKRKIEGSVSFYRDNIFFRGDHHAYADGCSHDEALGQECLVFDRRRLRDLYIKFLFMSISGDYVPVCGCGILVPRKHVEMKAQSDSDRLEDIYQDSGDKQENISTIINLHELTDTVVASGQGMSTQSASSPPIFIRNILEETEPKERQVRSITC